MLEFVSLFLGLTFGLHPVELVVADTRIVKVELRLDGQSAQTLSQAPWRAEIDFGRLAPHHLEAIAFDADNRELARAAQWLNVPRAPAEARLLLEKAEAGSPRFARLTWESWNGDAPSGVEVRFDGRKLSTPDVRRFQLPAVDLEAAHFLTAELQFPDGSWAHAEASFGGRFGEDVLTELTAVPVRLSSAKSEEPLDGCFEVDGQRAQVAAVEEGPADVLVVRDAGAEPLLQELRMRASVLSGGTAAIASGGGSTRWGVGSFRQRTLRDPQLYRYEMQLKEGDRLRFLWPNALTTVHPRYGKMTLVDGSEFLTAQDGGVLWLVTRAYPSRADGEQSLADTVAVAGLRAAANNHRRAVVVLLGQDEPADVSTARAEDVRQYLDLLQVPLHVWAGKAKKHRGGNWGDPRSIGTMVRFEDAVDALRADLATQRVVWLEGHHAAARVRVDPKRCPHVSRLDP